MRRLNVSQQIDSFSFLSLHLYLCSFTVCVRHLSCSILSELLILFCNIKEEPKLFHSRFQGYETSQFACCMLSISGCCTMTTLNLNSCSLTTLSVLDEEFAGSTCMYLFFFCPCPHTASILHWTGAVCLFEPE